MSQNEFRPDLRPKFVRDDAASPWRPDIDEATGIQHMVGVETFHHLPWPGDKSISQVTEKSWFGLSTAWQDVTATVWFVGQADGRPKYLGRIDTNLKWDLREGWDVPVGTDKISIRFGKGRRFPVGWCWEKKARV